MSHCTRFDFSYSDEEAIVCAFRKMGVQTSNELVAEYESEFQKKILSKLGHMGIRQMRAICGCKNGVNMFMCKVAENRFELLCEHLIYLPGVWADSFIFVQVLLEPSVIQRGSHLPCV